MCFGDRPAEFVVPANVLNGVLMGGSMSDDSSHGLLAEVREFRDAALAAGRSTVLAPGGVEGWHVPITDADYYPRLLIPAEPGGSLMIDAGTSLALATSNRLSELGLSLDDAAALIRSR